ncbi:Lon protease family protein [Halopseudomonas pertucinogena]|uniref:endopeptidase La n=1 Tax=Halopseudomonas pertucinogena TaxID=86175 RepID=A0ABQ2CRZ6_9GAMM|nr:ATP-binding protein [Halopseudomonas pertucinogena]GGJ00216.1 ATP-dependent protease [Halopseudomonas pertucinogena]
MTRPGPLRLQPEQLTAPIDLKSLGFDSTDDLEPFKGILGQDRAVEAMHFGVAMKRAGYNMFVMGEPGTGRFSYAMRYLQAEAKRMPTPQDCVYINNFDEPRAPKALHLAPGTGARLVEDIEQLVDNLLATFPAAFEHPAFQQKKSAIDQRFNRRYDAAIETVERQALERQIMIYRDGGNLGFTPIRDGKGLDEAQFAQLPDAERERYHEDIAVLEEQLSEALSSLPQWKRESSNELRELNEQTITEALQPLLDPLTERYCDNPLMCEYINAIHQNLLKVVVELLVDERAEARPEAAKKAALIDHYSPNLIVEHGGSPGAPVVHEPHPSYDNLFGRVEYTSEQGALVTTYRNIRAGALHRANNGYLVLEADKLLAEPFVWEALKRALHSRELKIESPWADIGRLTTVTLTPQVIPLAVKVVLIGSRRAYYMLQDYDPDFQELFRVLVDFDDYLPRTPDSIEGMAQLLKTRVDEEGMAPLTVAAVARILTYSARLAEHQQHLSASISDIFQLVAEADLVRELAGDKITDTGHIERALQAKENRTGRASARIREDMLSGVILIDTDGAAVGKCNGLTVLAIGDSVFGVPARISASVYPGSSGIVDIEREVNLGQPIHSKGVMILTGYLGSRYAQDHQLEISASIALEQSYGYIDGDSASLGEVCALISALARAPLQQCFAITGSINQFGEVQAIGGVNVKIEGFFRLCQARGLTGKQGVIIPRVNVPNLMLDKAVMDAAEEGLFHIYAVDNVDQALSLLAGENAGEPDEQGNFPAGSINDRVVQRLKQINQRNSSDDREEPSEAPGIEPLLNP